MKNIFFSIISTQKFIHTRQKNLKDTWLKNLNYVFASDIDTEDNVKLSDKIDHSSGEEKQLNSFKYLFKNKKNYDWYFFCDDDTFINLNNLNNFINKNETLESFGYVFCSKTCPENTYAWNRCGKNFIYYSGGAGFCLRADALEKISKLNTSERTGFGDLTSGFLYKEAKISLNHVSRLNINTPEKHGHTIEQIKKSISYHYINNDLMYELNKYQ